VCKSDQRNLLRVSALGQVNVEAKTATNHPRDQESDEFCIGTPINGLGPVCFHTTGVAQERSFQISVGPRERSADGAMIATEALSDVLQVFCKLLLDNQRDLSRKKKKRRFVSNPGTELR
jgi:hypothetical protein